MRCNFIKSFTHQNGEDLAPINSPTIQQYLQSLNVMQLSEDEKLVLEEHIVKEEIIEAVKSLSNLKSPGSDGLPVEVYKHYLLKLIPFLLELFKEVLQRQLLHQSARMGIITLLEKIGRDPLYLNDWRPLSLLNTDYKILAKILATRLNIVLSNIIHPMQTGLIKGRNIADNLIKLTNLIDVANKTNKKMLFISFDFEKTFDTMEGDAVDVMIQLVV